MNEKETQTEQAKTEQEKRKRKIGPGLILLLLLLIGAVVWFLTREPAYKEDDFFDPAAMTGILPGMSEAEIKAELDRVVEEGMLNISIASEISFDDGKAEGLANLYNTEANHYIIKVSIALEDGTVVYESKGIKPGQYIQYITLGEELSKGEYPATATFTAYTQDTRQIAGSAGAEITLYVKE